MATTHRTGKQRGQKINALHNSTLQENCSHWIRRRTAMPEATFFAFLFYFPCFHYFTTNVTRALPLEVIKGEAGARTTRAIKRKKRKNDQATIARTHLSRNHHHHSRDLGSALFLESL
jgi:hypothetical protein